MENLAVISVVYNNYSVLKDFIRSLNNQDNKDFKLFISDLSDNKKPIVIKELQLQVLPDKNKGFAYGVNLAIKKAVEEGYKYFCVINNDTNFKRDFIGNALSSIKKNPKSIIGGKIYYAGGYEYHKKRYSKKDRGNVIWYAGGFTDWKHAITIHKGVDEVDKGQYDDIQETEFITGALMLFDIDVINKIGFLDESFFLYFEDADYCIRALNKNTKLYYDPSIVIWHKVSQSTGGSGSDIQVRYQTLNQLKFGLRYAPLRTKLHLIKNFIYRFLKG